MYSNALILVAGGDPNDRETILQALGDEFHVVASQTMDDALAHMDDVSLVICDLESTQLNGVDLVRRWKSHEPHTPFLALTDGRDVGSAIEAMKNGVADCLVKPVDQDELRSASLQLLDNHAEDRGGRNYEAAASRKSHIDIPPGTSLEDLERAAVEQALVQHHGNRTHAAKTLGISVRTLQRKLKAWGMPFMSVANSGASSNGNFIVSTQASSNHNHLLSSHAH
jgi:DNA-binding NtrC family response regulator